MTFDEAQKILGVFGLRVRQVSLDDTEQLAAIGQESGDKVIVAAQDDWLDLVLANLETQCQRKPVPNQFVPMEGEYVPPTPAQKCPTGVVSHKWDFSIDESGVVLLLAEGEICPPAYPDEQKYITSTVCENYVGDSIGELRIGMEAISVALKFEKECDGMGPHTCDHDYWWIVEPKL